MDIDLEPTNNINTEFPIIQQVKKVKLPVRGPKPFIHKERISKIRTNIKEENRKAGAIIEK